MTLLIFDNTPLWKKYGFTSWEEARNYIVSNKKFINRKLEILKEGYKEEDFLPTNF